MDLETPIKNLYMVGPVYAKRLKQLGIETIRDLLYYFPFRYVDYSLISPIGKVQPGEVVSIRGKIISLENVYTFKGKKIQLGKIQDSSGIIKAVWFNQPFLLKILKKGSWICLSGKIDFWQREIALISPEYEILKSKSQIHTGRIVPIYHEIKGITSKWLRSRIAPLIKSVVPKIEEFFPSEIKKNYSLLDINIALEQIHFPKNLKIADIARKRFAFEELFFLHLAALLRKEKWREKKSAYQIKIEEKNLANFLKILPFGLTFAQKRVIKEILEDLKKETPMNRLLQGDVGSGKTVVAAAAIYASFLNHLQSAIMAPTEILAYQHYLTLNQILTPLGVKIMLLTSKKNKIEENFDLLIGTHALIYQRAKFEKLGLVVIDEQHRFGVEQRGKLIEKGGAPHVLTMTATPIPRTIALTLYGDLDLSILDELPPGRQKVKTWVVPPIKRTAAYEWIRKQIKENNTQAFIICPFIEESNIETLKSIKAATKEFERLKQVFPDFKLGLLHGRLKNKEKTLVLEKFKKNKYHLLVSTPVVEVGIDVPNATIMVVEGAQRFGLAQLHQLRGRVGRGNKPSYCLLFSDDQNPNSLRRLKALERINLGMKLAELDLKIRGPGEIYGIQQHGFFNLKVASFSDFPLVQQTKKAAEQIIANISQYPLLQEYLKKYIIKTIEPN